MSILAYQNQPNLLKTFRETTQKFKICPNRLWAAAGEQLPDIIPTGRSLPSHEDHDQCTFDFCEWSQKDFTSVEQRHECNDKANCPTVMFPKRILDEGITADRSPAWKLDGSALIDWPDTYMAISHVWSDGTGAGAWGDGVVNDCLYGYFRKIAQDFHCQGIWWDAICIPRGKEARSRALERMHLNYQDARITVVHDCFLRNWTWVGPEMACFAILVSPWFSRGWTALELAMSQKVKVIFNGQGGRLIIKDLDEEVLARTRPGPPSTPHERMSQMIRNLRARIASLDSLLGILGSRHTSWPKDMLAIAKLLVGVGKVPGHGGKLAQPQDVQNRILQKLGRISHGHLFHNSATIANGSSWCPTRLFEMPRSISRPSLTIRDNLDLEGIWQPVSPHRISDKASFVWHRTHPLLRTVVEAALEDRDCILLADHRRDIGATVDRAVVARKDGTAGIQDAHQYLGAVYFLPELPLDTIRKGEPRRIVLLGQQDT